MQAFPEAVHIPIAPLTLLFGPNSAGKSTVNDALTLYRLAWTRAPSEHRADDWVLRDGPNRERTLRSDWRLEDRTKYSEAPLWIEAEVECSELFVFPIEIDSLFRARGPISDEHVASLTSRVSFSPPFPGSMTLMVSVNGELLLVHDESEHVSINFGHPLLGANAEPVLSLLLGRPTSDGESPVICDGHWRRIRAPVPINGHQRFDWEAAARIILGERAPKNPNVFYASLTGFGEIYDALLKQVSHTSAFATEVSVVPASRTVPSDFDLTYLLDNKGTAVPPEQHGLALNGDPTYVKVAESAAIASKIAASRPSNRFSTARFEDEKRSRLFGSINRALSEHLFVERGYHLVATFRNLSKPTDRFSGPSGKAELFIVKLGLADAANRKLSFTDVGSGLGYVLPVFAALWSSSFTFVQQPELHLHPALQASIADSFIEATRSSKTLIVETHSEHLLLRLLRRIRQQGRGERVADGMSLKPSDIEVLYFNPTVYDRTEVHRLRVSDAGEFLDRWPRGFFNERDGELFDE
jgi:predicted ATPase